jgi:hypothetical protein
MKRWLMTEVGCVTVSGVAVGAWVVADSTSPVPVTTTVGSGGGACSSSARAAVATVSSKPEESAREPNFSERDTNWGIVL